MAKEITKTVYTFGELIELEKQGKATSRAVQRARDWLIEGLQTYDWWEFTYDTWKEALEQIGFTSPEIRFRGFSSQGDGASFTSEIDLPKLIDFLSSSIEASESINADENGKEDFRPWLVHKCHGIRTNPKFRHLVRLVDSGHFEASVSRNSSHYCHEYTVTFDCDLRDKGRMIGDEWVITTPRTLALSQEFRDAGKELVLDINRAIYRDLEEEYEYRTDDAQLIEDSDCNEYTFELSGRRDG